MDVILFSKPMWHCRYVKLKTLSLKPSNYILCFSFVTGLRPMLINRYNMTNDVAYLATTLFIDL